MSDAELRDRLVRVGIDLVTTEGLGAVTLREIARRAGVSHGAPRRYFPTHLELLSAIARAGFADLAARAEAALAQSPPNARARVGVLARAYVHFGRSQRGMFELMFRHDLLESGHLGLREVSLPLLTLLTDHVAAARGRRRAEPPTAARGRDRTEPPSAARSRGEIPAAVVAAALWANLHGIVQLANTGSLALVAGETPGDDVDALVQAALDAHLGRPA